MALALHAADERSFSTWRAYLGGSALAEQGSAATGAHFPRGGVLVTGGGLIFVATASDRKLRAYDQDNGKVVWEFDLPAGSEGVPAACEIGGREYLAFCVAAGNRMMSPKIPSGKAGGPTGIRCLHGVGLGEALTGRPSHIV